MADREFYWLLGLIVLLNIRLSIQSKHLSLLDNVLLDRDRLASEALGG